MSDKSDGDFYGGAMLGVCVGAMFMGMLVAAFGFSAGDGAERMLKDKAKVFYLLSDDGADHGLSEGDRKALLVRFLMGQEK